jgi:transcription antitermination factor NusG
MHTELSLPEIALEMPPVEAERFPWYAIRTRSNHEKLAASVLQGKGYEPYLPAYRRRRKAEVMVETEHLLFPGYVFCRFDFTKRLPILMTTGVISVLGFGKEPAPIPDEEMEAVEAVLRSGYPAEPCAYLREGQRVRVTGGSLDGVEGIVVKKKNRFRMVVSVTMLQRSISVEIDGDQLAII